MIIVFFGNTPKSLIGAKLLHKALGLSLIVTNTDKRGKKDEVIMSPLKTFALEKNIEVLCVNKLDTNAIETINSYSPDFFVVEDYGLILPKRLLEIPKYAPLNVHHSLLPKYRGPAPAPYAILNGDEVSGVSIIHMNDKVDAGDIYAQEAYSLSPEDTTDSLLTKLNELGGKLAINVIEAINAKKAVRTPQSESEVSFTHFMEKKNGYIDMENLPAKNHIDRMIRAYYPWPNVWTTIKFKNKDMRIKFLPNKMLQMEGKSPISVKDFINGYPELEYIVEKVY